MSRKNRQLLPECGRGPVSLECHSAKVRNQKAGEFEEAGLKIILTPDINLEEMGGAGLLTRTRRL